MSWPAARHSRSILDLRRRAVGPAAESATRGPASEELYSTDRPQCGRRPCRAAARLCGHSARRAARSGRRCPAISAARSWRPKAQSGPLAVDPEQQRTSQESEAARTSRVFASTNVGQRRRQPTPAETTSNAASPSDEAFAQNGQDRKLAFVNAAVDRRTTSPDRVARASLALCRPGRVRHSGRPYYWHPLRSARADHGACDRTVYLIRCPVKSLLVPQGARLIGIYDSHVTHGQSRVLLVWTRLIMPNGRSIVLERQPGADTAGYAGLHDEVDHHWGELFKAALLSTLLGCRSRTWVRLRCWQRKQRHSAGPSPWGRGFPEPDRSADRSAQSQHPADADNPAGFSGAGDRQSRPRARTIQRLKKWQS